MEKFKTNLNNFDLRKQEGKLVTIFVLALLFYLVFILFNDVKKIEKITMNFNWSIIPFLMILTLCNYFFRALRFYIYLRIIHVKISFRKASAIFLSGLSMTVTPGKSGEIVKAYLLKKNSNVTVSEVLPLLIIERMTDGIAMILLGLGGISFIKNSTLFFIFASVFVVAFIIVMRGKKYFLPIVKKLEKKFPHFKLLTFFEIFFDNSQKLVSFKNLSIGILIGCIAWFFEGYSLYLVVQQFIPIHSLADIAKSLFIFSFSSIAGFFVLIPGGIGVAEGSITYFLTNFFRLSTTQSVFITLLFRFITLWFGVCLGLVTLIYSIRSGNKKILKT
jgi:uncharacterized protein (TIRG00374 family)